MFGRYLFAVGRNEEAARYSGIQTGRVVAAAYVICGALAGLSSIFLTMYTRSISPASHGNFYELYGIAAAVLGGCSLRGGEGSIVGIVLGTILLQILAESREPLGNTEFTQLRGDGSRHPDRRAGRPAIQRLPRAQNSSAGGQEQLRQDGRLSPVRLCHRGCPPQATSRRPARIVRGSPNGRFARGRSAVTRSRAYLRFVIRLWAEVSQHHREEAQLLRSPLCDVLGIDVPIILAAMGGTASSGGVCRRCVK